MFSVGFSLLIFTPMNVVDRFCIALFSTVEQTDCARM